MRRKFRDEREARPRDAGEHELRDAVARSDRDLSGGVAVPRRDQAGAFVVGVDETDRIPQHQPLAMRESGARQHQGAPARIADAEGDAGRDQDCARLGRQRQRRVEAGVQVETRGLIRAVMREAPSRQARIENFQFDIEHRSNQPPRAAAMRSARRAATARLLIAGQSSTPSASIRWIVLSSPPKVCVPRETSLARIQSQPLRTRLARPLATTSPVSAAKPMTRAGRSLERCAMLARMSGFSTRRNVGALPASFFSFCVAAASMRQSATAAAITATSTGNAASHAASISAAVSTGTSRTPRGAGSWVGPDTSTVSAPRPAKAAAMAWPCLPDEWFEI